MVIGITGGISSGKSTISKILISRNYKLIDCDLISKELTNIDEVVLEIAEIFGDEVIDGTNINRKKLGELIFNNESKKKQLENIIHPRVVQKVIDEIKSLNEKIIFVDCPLLFEAKLEYLFDKIIVVYVNFETQVKRLISRDKIDIDFALKKINAQMRLDDKAKLADFVIDNSYSLEETINQLDNIIRSIKNEI